MNKQAKADVVAFIESRFDWAREHFTDVLRAELEIAIDLAGLTGAIDVPEQRHYKERLNRFIESDHQQWLIANRRAS